MVHQMQQISYPTRSADQGQTIFFYDGEFRTWGQVEQRAKLNAAISKYVTGRVVYPETIQTR